MPDYNELTLIPLFIIILNRPVACKKWNVNEIMTSRLEALLNLFSLEAAYKPEYSLLWDHASKFLWSRADTCMVLLLYGNIRQR